MSVVFFVSHPEVTVDPSVPVPCWRPADKGIRRMRTFAASPRLDGLSAVWASGEAKAIEAAGLPAAEFGLAVGVHKNLGENDRSSTGYLAPPEFEKTVEAFFAQPDQCIRGWERAVDAQERVATDILDRSPNGPVALVAHGGVGTLLLCRYAQAAISRAADQPSQGHFWTFDRKTREVRQGWRSIDE